MLILLKINMYGYLLYLICVPNLYTDMKNVLFTECILGYLFHHEKVKVRTEGQQECNGPFMSRN